MSYVTNIILTCEVGEGKAILNINAYLSGAYDGAELSDIGEHAGGTKHLEATVLVGAFNYLALAGLMYTVRHAPWDSPESVRLFAKSQGENGFNIHLYGAGCY